MTDEPDEGAYVVVLDDNFADLFKRDDAFAAKLDGRPDARWVGQHGDITAKTWQELTEMGPIAYVGVFVQRGERPIPKGELWASL